MIERAILLFIVACGFGAILFTGFWLFGKVVRWSLGL